MQPKQSTLCPWIPIRQAARFGLAFGSRGRCFFHIPLTGETVADTFLPLLLGRVPLIVRLIDFPLINRNLGLGQIPFPFDCHPSLWRNTQKREMWFRIKSRFPLSVIPCPVYVRSFPLHFPQCISRANNWSSPGLTIKSDRIYLSIELI